MQSIEQQENVNDKPLNVWKSVWIHPRKTVRYAIEHKSSTFVILIAIITGFFSVLDQASIKDLGDSMSIGAIFLITLILGPIAGLISLYIGSGIFHLFAKMFGGIGNFAATKMAFTISNLILIVLGVVWVPDLLIIGKGMFVAEYDFSIVQFLWLLVSVVLNFTLGIWTMVALIGTLAEAHSIAIWKAVLVVLLPIVIFVFIIAAIVLLTVPFMLF